ncbi:MAG: NAD(+) diphosphatase [Chloroflexi bacterium]|nr:NAD(+) diphosphatase [Chloroflexota bacterium]
MTYPPHIFADNPFNRGEVERRDEDWIIQQSQEPRSKFLPFSNLNVLLTDDSPPELGWLSTQQAQPLPASAEWIFLGLLDGVAHFAYDLSKNAAVVEQVLDATGWHFEDCRTAGETMSGPNTGMLSQARSQLDWNLRHGFCSVCGHPTDKGRGGQVRQCPACNSQHFPRTDPVVITVVADTDGDRCLLGQSRGRLQRMRAYSALAGFMDQGECIEEAVAREVMEEAGIQVKNVRYHSSQPWPFPSSLMIGCIAEADTTNINMDNEEMTDVKWFTRAEVLKALEGRSEELTVPGPIAIAHHLIKAWATGNTP